MQVASTLAVGLVGLTGHIVEVEGHVADGLPAFILVGLPDTSLGEAPNRVKAACSSQRLPVPVRRVTVNLSPASLPKHGSSFDLAIAAAVLGASGIIDRESAARTMHLGELGLDGRLRPIRGVLPAVAAAARAGVRRVVVPYGNRHEAQLVPDVVVHPAVNIADMVRVHHGPLATGDGSPDIFGPGEQAPVLAPENVRSEGAVPDLIDVVGQPEARQALAVAAAGGHHLLMLGPPGAGKTMLASRLPGLLPDLDDDDAIAVTSVHSVAGTLGHDVALVRRPPLEEPHHSATTVAVIGGGTGYPLPGAASRAHCGVLFLDEAPEFRKGVLDALRQPMETGQLAIARARGSARFPARFQLVLAANPCPCGRSIGAATTCSCSSLERRRYLGRLSGPVLDRIDVRVEMQAPSKAALRSGEAAESTEQVAKRVAVARQAARARWESTNAGISGPALRSAFRLPPAITATLDRTLDRGLLTLRGYDRVLRLAWTLADLDQADQPDRDHLGVALMLRALNTTGGLR